VLLNKGVVFAGLTKFSVPAITQAIVDQGAVFVYVRNTGSTTGWYPLPYSSNGNTMTLSDFGVGYVNIQANFTQTSGIDFRVLVISGAGVTILTVTNPNLNFKNFADVAAALHLSN
jgi:hypothetical protein